MPVRSVLFLLIALIGGVAIANAPLPMETPARICAGIFFVALILWMTEAVPLYVTSFIILFSELAFLAPALGVKGSVFLSPFFSNIVALFLGGLLLAEAGRKYHVDEWVAKRILAVAGRRPGNVLLAMMLATAMLSMWMSNTATTAMMLIITGAIVVSLGEGSAFAKAFYLGIPFAANLGGMMTPVGTPPNAIAMQQINQYHPGAVTFLDWMIAAVPLVALLLFLLWRLLLVLYKPPEADVEFAAGSHFRLDGKTGVVVGLFTVTVALWLTGKWHGMASGTVALIPAIVFLGSGILEKRDFKGISWDVLFLVGGGLSLSVAMKTSGLGNVVVEAMALEGMGTFGVLIVFLVVGAILTAFMSNTATANLIIPLAFVIPGVSDLPLAVGTALAVSAVMVLPVSTPPNAIAYSSGMVELRDMARAGAIVSAASLVLVAVLGYQWWRLLGLF